MVLLSLTAVFYAIVVVFAVLIDVAGLIQPTCIYVGSLDNYQEAGGYFIDALAISWTTFSTVVSVVLCVSWPMCLYYIAIRSY